MIVIELSVGLEGSVALPPGGLRKLSHMASLEMDDLAPRVSVVELALFLLLQSLCRNADLSASLGRDDVFPGSLKRAASTSALDTNPSPTPTRSPTPTANQPTPTGLTSSFASQPPSEGSDDVGRIQDFFLANLDRILELVQTADLQIKGWH